MTEIENQMKNNASAVVSSLTRAEIFHQPELWEATVAQIPAAEQFAMGPGVRIAVTGAGTSAYAAAAVAAGAHRGVAIPSTDLLIDPNLLADAAVLISLARSGDSPESIAVVQQAQRLAPAIRHLAITCNPRGRLANLPGVQAVVLDPRTNDRSLVMTSSFTNLVLAGLCLYHGDRLRQEITTIRQRVTEHLGRLETIAASVAAEPTARVVCLASAPLFPLAREAALKILEMTAGGIVPMAETFLGLRHGPMSFLQEDTLVVGFLSTDPTRLSYELDLLEELRRKGLGRIVVVGGTDDRREVEFEQVPAAAPDLPDVLRVPFEAPFAQLLALQFSVRSGLNPDQPSPEGVISRVVGEFRIHPGEVTT